MAGNPIDRETRKELRELTELIHQYQAKLDRMCSYEAILPRIAEPMALIDRRYVYQAVNNAYLSFYRKTREEVVGRPVQEVMGEDIFREKEKVRLDRALAGEEAEYEDRFSFGDAEPRYMLLRYYPLVSEEGAVEGVISSAWDITERKSVEKKTLKMQRDLEAEVKEHTEKLSQAITALEHEVEVRTRAEDDLKASREKLSKIFRAIPDPVSITTYEDGIFLDVNESFLHMTGYTRDEVIGRTSLELGIWYDPSERAKVMEMIREQGGVRNHEVKFRSKTGGSRVMLVSVELMELEGKQHVLFVSRDITDRKNLETEVIRSQKMEAIGRLAGGITHDFNNLLTAIDGYCELALLRIGKPDQVRANILKIKDVKNTASSLIRQLLAFSRRQTVKPRSLDMNTVVENMQSMLKQFIGESVELKIRLQRDIGNVYADQGHVEQIIMNLVLNARDAMKKGGTLSISTSRVHLDESAAEMHVDLVPGDYIKLEVSDTGVGMDEETMAHAFEPFFTTKESGKGTGLGLATVYGIVRNNGGRISLKSEIGRGTTFEVFLPVSREPAEAAARRPEKVGARGGSEVILVVEDNRYVLDLLTEVLGSLGYTLLKAKSGEEAMDVCAAHSGDIDLVIADVVLPGMDGPAVVKILLKSYPGMKILYITGYPGEVVSLYGISDTERHLLQKPFSAAALTEKVREVLDEPPGHAA